MKSVRYYVISLIWAVSFLIVGTCFWFKLHLEYQAKEAMLARFNQDVSVDDSVVINDLPQIPDNKANKLTSYRFVLNNQSIENKNFYLKLVDDYYRQYNEEGINNNYLRYMIRKNNQSYSHVHSLNMDGKIYFDTLDPNTSTVYELKIWVSENYQDSYNYHGQLVIVYL